MNLKTYGLKFLELTSGLALFTWGLDLELEFWHRGAVLFGLMFIALASRL